jgi:beta-ureidopropionase / N-carbamoyl-L-amino-acid hydrolase
MTTSNSGSKLGTAVRIDQERLLADLAHLGKIGLGADGGITRKALSREDAQARAYVAERMRAAGLEVRHDEVGNLRARRRTREGAGWDSPEPVVMTGSHLDSVPSGGTLDGPLGVVGAVCALEALDAAGVATRRPLEIIVFVGEEGSRFRRGTIGSAALSGHVSVDSVLKLVDPDGVVYRDALATYGDEGSPIAAKAQARRQRDEAERRHPVEEESRRTVAVDLTVHEPASVAVTSGAPVAVVTEHPQKSRKWVWAVVGVLAVGVAASAVAVGVIETQPSPAHAGSLGLLDGRR